MKEKYAFIKKKKKVLTMLFREGSDAARRERAFTEGKASRRTGQRTYPEYQIEEEQHVLQTAEAAPGHAALLKL
jgi:hypothetical protein